MSILFITSFTRFIKWSYHVYPLLLLQRQAGALLEMIIDQVAFIYVNYRWVIRLLHM